MPPDPIQALVKELATKRAMQMMYATGEYSYRQIAEAFGVSHMFVKRAVTLAVTPEDVRE